VYDDFNIFVERVHAIKRTEALVAYRQEIGLEINVDRTKYVVMSRD